MTHARIYLVPAMGDNSPRRRGVLVLAGDSLGEKVSERKPKDRGGKFPDAKPHLRLISLECIDCIVQPIYELVSLQAASAHCTGRAILAATCCGKLTDITASTVASRVDSEVEYLHFSSYHSIYVSQRSHPRKAIVPMGCVQG
jgi:hypothetical protein